LLRRVSTGRALRLNAVDDNRVVALLAHSRARKNLKVCVNVRSYADLD
jgi:hypothetical protein